jgi:serine/threonine protein kinase
MIDADAPGDVDVDLTPFQPADTVADPFDRVAEEFVERCRRGESPSVGEYEARFPEHAQRIRELLPSVAMMEQLKRRLRSSRDSDSQAPASVPERLGDYRLIRELGRGGMGIVYEAVQESLGRHVALKLIPRHGVLDARRRQRFEREAQAVARLHHTNIVPIFAVGEHDGLPFYAMQYIRGSGLDRLVETWREKGRQGDEGHWRFVARVGVQAAEGLQYAHDQGILHRDIKPANLLIDENQVAWITDFGLAKLIGRDDLTHSGDVIGTLRYLAPEALRGQTDHRSDIYSLGLSLYEVLTLHSPFGDLSPSELLRCVTEEQPARPRTLDRNIPLDLETIILKATAREPADDLRAFLDDRPIRARRATPLERLNRWCRRNKTVAAMTAIAVASLLAAAVWGWAMYAARTRALERAEANVALSLEALNNLFDMLADRDDFGPVLVGLEPGPGPGPPPGDRRSDMGWLRNFLDDSKEKDAALLQSILEFYDHFAERNKTNSHLELEAARSLRKVASLYRMLERYTEADKALDRATQRFETLAAQHPDNPDYRFELARTYALDNQHPPDKIAPDRVEQGIRKALPLAQTLADKSPKPQNYVMALARWKARLGDALRRQDRLAEAETAYRESIAHDESLLDRVSFADGVRKVIAGNREALGRILLARGQRGDAKAELDRAFDGLNALRGYDRRKPGGDGHLAHLFLRLAESYGELGQAQRAAECAERAEKLGPRGPRHGPAPHEGPPRGSSGPQPPQHRRPPT